MRAIVEYRLDRDVVEIPFEFVNNQILVKVAVDDKTELAFLFDTGASAPVVDKALNINGTHVRDTIVQEAEGITAAEMIWVGKISLGGERGTADVYNIPTLVTDMTLISRLMNRRIDGVLGISFMAGYVVEFDYVREMLRFFPKRSYTIATRKPDNARTFLLDLKPSNPKAALPCMRIVGKLHAKYDYEFLLDTGFGGYVSVARAAAVESGLLRADTPRVSAISYGASRAFQTLRIRAGFLMLGSINLSGRVIAVDVRNNDEYGQVGLVGNRLLQNYRMTLDYARRKLWMERVTDKEPLDEAEKPSLGLAVRADGQRLRVENVAKNSPAARAGAQIGDAILSINGEETANMSVARALNLLSAPKGPVTLNLRRAEETNRAGSGQTLTLTLEPSSPLDWKP
jgi:predicted aspartyl protease